MKVINIPIEPLEERYSIQWNTWFKNYFEKHFINYVTIEPEPLTKRIESGAFLDVIGTNCYKARQLEMITTAFHRQVAWDGAIFFFHDLWYPGIEMLAYIQDALDMNFKIVGCLHAGTYDKTDFISYMGMGDWGEELENSWFKIIDKIFVGSFYHKNMIVSNRNINPEKIVVTGFPIYPQQLKNLEKQKIVLFPHRLDPEKNPDKWDVFVKKYEKSIPPDWTFVRKSKSYLPKKEYYDLLEKANIVISMADHENWGIVMQEALFANCIPFVPNRLSYPELFLPCFQYETEIELFEKIFYAIVNPEFYFNSMALNKNRLIQKGEKAIPNMFREINDL